MSRCLLGNKHVNLSHDIRARRTSLHVQNRVGILDLAEGPASISVEGGQARCLDKGRSALRVAFMDSRG